MQREENMNEKKNKQTQSYSKINRCSRGEANFFKIILNCLRFNSLINSLSSGLNM